MLARNSSIQRLEIPGPAKPNCVRLRRYEAGFRDFVDDDVAIAD